MITRLRNLVATDDFWGCLLEWAVYGLLFLLVVGSYVALAWFPGA